MPLQSEGDMDFRKDKLQLGAETMQETAQRILAAFLSLQDQLSAQNLPLPSVI